LNFSRVRYVLSDVPNDALCVQNKPTRGMFPCKEVCVMWAVDLSAWKNVFFDILSLFAFVCALAIAFVGVRFPVFKELLPLGCCFDMALCVTTPQDRIELATAKYKATREYIALVKIIWSSILHMKKGNAGTTTECQQLLLLSACHIMCQCQCQCQCQRKSCAS
jgi:hypothetical protein